VVLPAVERLHTDSSEDRIRPRLGECCVADGFEERIDEVNGAEMIVRKVTGSGEGCDEGEEVDEHAANASGLLSKRQRTDSETRRDRSGTRV